MPWPVNARTSAMMDEAQALYGATITATKGSPVAAGGGSAYTHTGEGAIDVFGDDLPAINAAMRQVGFASFERGIEGDGFDPHVHGVAIGEPDLHEQAQAQVDSYLAGYNGLRNNLPDSGPRDWVGVTWETYSGGTYVPPTGGDPVFMWDQYPGDRSGSFMYAPDGILAGSPTVPFNPGYTTFNRSHIATPGATMTLTAGDSVMFAASQNYEYGRPVDPTAASWLIRSTGGGTLAVADGFDVDYNYPDVTPTWVPRSRIGDDADGITHFTFDPDMVDIAHLWTDGFPLIRITCTAGSAVVDFVGLQVEGAAGFWLPEGTFVWSDTFPATTREPINDLANTYAVYIDGGGVERWVVDDTEVMQPVRDGGGDVWNEWSGAATSYADAADANAGANADFQPTASLPGVTAVVSNTHVPLSGDIFGGFDPEHWVATVLERVRFATAPTEATLSDVEPDAIDDLEAWQYEGFEWTDADTGFLGWIQYGVEAEYEHFIETAGDTDTVTYSLITSATGGEDLHSTWFATGAGTEIASGTTPDTAPGTDPAQVAIPETFLATSDRLVYQRLELARRFTDQTDQFTTEFGYPAGDEGTTATLAVVRISDGAHVANRQVAARFRVPPWRYKAPLFRSGGAPAPTIDFDEEGPTSTVTWLRQRQRDDGLGNSVIRARGGSSRQTSLRQRGYR